MKIEGLSDDEAKICGYENGEELKKGVKHWHKVEDLNIITFIGFDFMPQ